MLTPTSPCHFPRASIHRALTSKPWNLILHTAGPFQRVKAAGLGRASGERRWKPLLVDDHRLIIGDYTTQIYPIYWGL